MMLENVYSFSKAINHHNTLDNRSFHNILAGNVFFKSIELLNKLFESLEQDLALNF